MNVDNIPLVNNEVRYVPVSMMTKRYITFYNSGYLIQSIENFVDLKGVQNTRSFKSAPYWCSYPKKLDGELD